MSYSEVDLYIMCFSVVNRISFNNIEDHWHKEVMREEKDRDRTPLVVLVGTKTDLRSDPDLLAKSIKETGQSIVTAREGEKMREKINALAYVECSAFEMQNVDNVFRTCLKVLLASSRMKEVKKKSQSKLKKWLLKILKALLFKKIDDKNIDEIKRLIREMERSQQEYKDIKVAYSYEEHREEFLNPQKEAPKPVKVKKALPKVTTEKKTVVSKKKEIMVDHIGKPRRSKGPYSSIYDKLDVLRGDNFSDIGVVGRVDERKKKLKNLKGDSKNEIMKKLENMDQKQLKMMIKKVSNMKGKGGMKNPNPKGVKKDVSKVKIRPKKKLPVPKSQKPTKRLPVKREDNREKEDKKKRMEEKKRVERERKKKEQEIKKRQMEEKKRRDQELRKKKADEKRKREQETKRKKLEEKRKEEERKRLSKQKKEAERQKQLRRKKREDERKRKVEKREREEEKKKKILEKKRMDEKKRREEKRRKEELEKNKKKLTKQMSIDEVNVKDDPLGGVLFSSSERSRKKSIKNVFSRSYEASKYVPTQEHPFKDMVKNEKKPEKKKSREKKKEKDETDPLFGIQM